MPEIENKIYDSATENHSDTNNPVNLDVSQETQTEFTEKLHNEQELVAKEAENKDEPDNQNLNDGTVDTSNDSTNKFEIEIAEALDIYNILTIDDDKWIQRIFSQYLTQWGFHNISAMDPYSGLEEAIKNKPLIIFLDILLPEVHGDMLIKFLKRMEFTSKIPVVIISGNLNKDLIKSTYLSGAAGFITKPFNQETLFNKIKEVIDPAIFNRMIKDGKINTSQIKKKPHLGA